MPFNWLFAIVAGAIILFLAIFASTRYVSIERYKYDTEIATQLSLLLNPLETTIASATATEIKMPTKLKLSLSCKFTGMGKEDIKISTLSNIGNKWQTYGAKVSIYNKYIFSNSQEEGQRLYLFSKTFNMPFKIADLIYLTTSEFCFVNPPEVIASELSDLEMRNIRIVKNKKECGKSTKKMKTVCFGIGECEINVYGQCYGYECSNSYKEYEYGFVEINNQENKIERLYYLGPELLYAAIFSSPSIYICNLQRIMYRIIMVSRLYIEKINILKARGCNTGDLEKRLSELIMQASSSLRSNNIIQMKKIAEEVNNINSGLVCKIF